MGKGTREMGSKTWDGAFAVASKTTRQNDADNFSTHSEVLDSAAENCLTQNKSGLFKAFTSLSWSKDKVRPGSIFLDFSFLTIWISYQVFPEVPVLHSKKQTSKQTRACAHTQTNLFFFLKWSHECTCCEQKYINVLRVNNLESIQWYQWPAPGTSFTLVYPLARTAPYVMDILKCTRFSEICPMNHL